MPTIDRGVTVKVRTADNKVLARRAVSGVEEGDSFPIVWVCREEEWEAARREGREPQAVPWPADAVETAA
ncbi:MAG: hypothetical protein ACREK5_08475 [Gemmatimonadota bacterium]